MRQCRDRGSTELKSYKHGNGQFAFHYFVDDTIPSANVWFLCMAGSAMRRRIPYAFLLAVQRSFMEMFSKEPSEGANGIASD
eukprot:Skav204249  [mRNA]  locus=scaffold912:23691:23936:- [translate_table: standard]